MSGDTAPAHPQAITLEALEAHFDQLSPGALSGPARDFLRQAWEDYAADETPERFGLAQRLGGRLIDRRRAATAEQIAVLDFDDDLRVRRVQRLDDDRDQRQRDEQQHRKRRRQHEPEKRSMPHQAPPRGPPQRPPHGAMSRGPGTPRGSVVLSG